MFDFLFGWRKASKCKKLIKMVMYLLTSRKDQLSCIVTLLRHDVARLIKHGEYQSALSKVEQIYKDECIIVVYDFLVKFCDFISTRLSYISRNKDCPDDIKEAISSLIFASARIHNLPELLRLRELFSERFGKCFEAMALEANHINFWIRKYLSMNQVPDEAKYRLFDEIRMNVIQSSVPLGKELINLSPKRFDLEANDEETGVYPNEYIEEFRFQLNDCLNGKDQRGFLFISAYITNSSTYNDAFLGTCTRKATSTRCERSATRCEGGSGVKRSYSHPNPSPSHVHPKLPDYDDILAMSMALKEEHLRKKDC